MPQTPDQVELLSVSLKGNHLAYCAAVVWSVISKPQKGTGTLHTTYKCFILSKLPLSQTSFSCDMTTHDDSNCTLHQLREELWIFSRKNITVTNGVQNKSVRIPEQKKIRVAEHPLQIHLLFAVRAHLLLPDNAPSSYAELVKPECEELRLGMAVCEQLIYTDSKFYFENSSLVSKYENNDWGHSGWKAAMIKHRCD